MTRMILSRVLPFPKGHIVRRLNDACTTLPGMLEMPVDVRNGDVHVLSDDIWLWSAKGPALAPKHDGALCNHQLGVSDNPISFGSETFRETERPTEPIDGRSEVFVDYGRDHRGTWCRSIRLR